MSVSSSLPARPAHPAAPRHRRVAPRRRRTAWLATASLTLGTVLASVLVASPARAAGPWFVAPTGNNAASCLSAAAPCATVTGALAKAGFQAGDTINVAAGTYADRPVINKRARIVGAGTGATFTGTPALSTGWAMAVTVAGVTELQNITLTSGGYQLGGAFVATAGTVRATDVSITNSRSVSGGGVYLFAGASLEMTRGQITGNTATATAANFGWGGGAYVSAGATLTLDRTLVANNKADAAGFGFSYGGGIVSLGSVTVTDAVLRDNLATSNSGGFGGAIFDNGTALQLSGTEFTRNKASIGGAFGGARPLTATNLTFTDNQALAGGAFYSTAATSLTGGSFTGNKATTNFGGGLYVTGTPTAPVNLVLDSVDLSANSAPTAGGALYTSADVTTTVRNGSLVSDNTSQSGAGLYSAGTLTVRDSAITGNDASFQGGGVVTGSTVAADTPTATLVDTVVEDNTAAFVGGGVVALAKSTLTVTRGRITANTALGGGGVVVSDNANAAIDGARIDDNIATASGGGGVFNAGRTTIRRSTLDGNEAIRTSGNTGLGGAIYTGSSANGATTTLEVEASTLSHNRAYAGSALLIYSTGTGTVVNTTVVDRSTITGNTSSSAFGAIENVARPLTITNSTITDNVATAGGAGAIYALAGSTGGISGTVLAGNTPVACIGPVSNSGGNHAGPGNSGCGVAPNADPLLGVLGDNGGPTQTRLPAPSSVLLDAITCSGDAVDQRGSARPAGARCDIGAVERAQEVPTIEGPEHVDLAVGSPAAPAATYTSTGSPTPDLSVGTLPAGLTFTDNGDGTGTISGTPSGPGGVFAVTVTATNEAGSDSTVTELEISEAPELSGPTSGTYTVGEPGGPDVFEQVGGHPVATLSTDSDLPGGVTFSDGGDGTGTLAGTPTGGSGGTYDITIDGTNGVAPDATWPFALTVNEAPTLDAPATATFRVGTPGSTALDVDGFPAPVVTASGLPDGLSVNGAAISGTPANGTGGVYDVTLTADNGVGDDATDTVEVTVEEAPSVAGPAEVRMVAGSPSTIVYAGGGFPEPTLTLEGALPAGVTFVDNGDGTATLAGTPAVGSIGSYSVTVTATNGVGGPATQTVGIEVVPSVSIVTTTLPDAAVGATYDVPIAVEGGLAPYVFRISAGSLPAGLQLTGDGRITGTPSGTPGTSTFTVEVTDSGTSASVVTRQFTIQVTKGVTTLVMAPLVVTGNVIGNGFLTATLTGGSPGQPLAGKTVQFKTKGVLAFQTTCTAVTDANGVAKCKPTLVGTLQVIAAGGVTASFAGDAQWQPSEVRVGIL